MNLFLQCMALGAVLGVVFVVLVAVTVAFLFWRARRAARRQPFGFIDPNETVPAFISPWSAGRGEPLSQLEAVFKGRRSPKLLELERLDLLFAFVVGDSQVLWTKRYVEGRQ